MRSTFMANEATVERKWYVVDATDLILGRLSTEIATVLRGKHKTTYTPHFDSGDYVIVVNAEKIALSGKKLSDKKYYRHSGFSGGLKVRTAAEMLDKQPQKVLELAIKGMLPRGPQGDNMYRRLFVYVGNEHPHAAQQPVALPKVK